MRPFVEAALIAAALALLVALACAGCVRECTGQHVCRASATVTSDVWCMVGGRPALDDEQGVCCAPERSPCEGGECCAGLACVRGACR